MWKNQSATVITRKIQKTKNKTKTKHQCFLLVVVGWQHCCLHTMSTATAEDIMWSQRHEMVGWLDGTWGRVMGEFGGISSRRCEVFASFVSPPPCFLWTVAFFASVIRGYLLSHLRLLAVFLHVYPTHTHIVDCFGVKRLLFWWAKGFFLVVGEVVGDFAPMCIVAFLLEQLCT